jgi:hypothetical protein
MSTINAAPEVSGFLATVRTQLADLDPDEQREILDGLEADLTDLVAERGGEALGDPVAYARELRAAAGLEPEMRRSRSGRPLREHLHAVLDAAHGRWDRLVDALPGDAGDLLTVLRPVWWVLRGWIAVQTAALWLGDWSLTIIPGSDLPGLAAVVAGVLLSIQLGRGRLWPADGWRRMAALRVVLLGLNVFALAMLPVVLNGLDHGSTDRFSQGFDRGYQEGARDTRDSGPKAGLYLDGTWVSQIYPYDAKGRPLVGVQLFNQIGQPIDVVTQPEYEIYDIDDQGNEIDVNGNLVDPNVPQLPRIFYPWTNGTTQVFNVFPIPSRLQQSEELSPTAFTEAEKPTVGPFPLASVPQVSLPGITPGVQRPAG